MRRIQHILFDLDGTLVDSSEAIRASLSQAVELLGLRVPTGFAVRGLIGMPLLDIFREQFGLVGEPAERAIDAYREHYDRTARAGTRIYEGVERTLGVLHAAGIGLFVATVKPSPIATKVLRDMGLAGYFKGVAGSSMDHALRDKGGIIRQILQSHDLDARHTMMVGDRGQDIEGARQNGLYAVGVTYGFGSLEELTAAGPDRLVARSGEIATLVMDQPSGD